MFRRNISLPSSVSNTLNKIPAWKLLGFASAVILGSESEGLMTTFYCLRVETPPTWRARSPYLYSPGTGWPCYTPRHGCPFRRLLRLARRQSKWSQNCFTTGRLPPINSSWLQAHWDSRPGLFSTEPLCNILSDKKMGLSPMNMLDLSSSVRIAHIACYWKLFPAGPQPVWGLRHIALGPT
jgi:hypothetical protein